MTFGERLLKMRRKRGLSQEQLGDRTNIDKRLISRYETNKSLPNIGAVKKFAEVLEVSTDYLLDLDFSIFIDDSEMRTILKDYNHFDKEEQEAIKKFMKAWSIYHRIQNAERELTTKKTATKATENSIQSQKAT